MTGTAAAVELEDIGLAVSGVHILDGVSLSIAAGEMVGVIGPNGAGKTTLFNVVSGVVRPTRGSVRLGGRDVTRASMRQRARRGLGRTFQSSSLFDALTVLENVRLAVQAMRPGTHRRGLNLWSVWSDHADLLARADQLLAEIALKDKENELVANLPHGDQRKLEVALLMALEPQVYMFDEPTAGMNHAEAPVILDLIRKLKADNSKTILLVEHKMDVVRELADRIIVLHNGTLVADGEPAQVIASPVVQEAYLGVSAQKEAA